MSPKHSSPVTDTPLTAKEAMAIGIEIAEKHKEAVLQLIAMAGSAPVEQALHGNLVWLASQIMVALQSHSASTQRQLSGEERHAIGHARYQVEHSTPENPECCFDYQLVGTLVEIIDRAYSVTSTERCTMSDYTAWVIEINDTTDGPEYFRPSDDDDWVKDHDKALHFARQVDAETLIEYYGWTRAKAVEHMWPAVARPERNSTENTEGSAS